MIYLEQDSFSYSLFKVEEVGGPFFGWNTDDPEGWYGNEFLYYPCKDDFTQAFLAPSILDRWSS